MSMFSSQTSSFQDSIDVEERDDFDGEEIAAYSQKIHLNCYYTIYLYQGTRYWLMSIIHFVYLFWTVWSVLACCVCVNTFMKCLFTLHSLSLSANTQYI